MRFFLRYDGKYEDVVLIEGETSQICLAKALTERDKRGWEPEYCDMKEV